MARLAALTAAFFLLAGCTADPDTDTEPEPAEPAEPASTVVALSPEQHLVRASMALRGTRPSRDELEDVADDPDALGAIVDRYLATEAFGRTMRNLHSESLMLEPDWLYYPAGFPNVGDLAGYDMATINHSIMQAPLRLIEQVVMEDRPYTEIVTADHTVADSISSLVWNLAYDPSGPEWQSTRYEDGRGNAGILTDSWLYVRYQSTPSNANRQRANALSRGLLCYDFLSRDVDLDTTVDVADPNAVQAAVVANGACASCHQALDPLASYFKDVFPLLVPQDVQSYPVETPMWLPGVFEDVLGVDMREPSYFGLAGDDLEDLGQLIADDPRFSRCAAQRFYSYFNQVPLSEVPFEATAELQARFIDSGFSAKALAKAIVMSNDFAASYSEDDADAEHLNGFRRARPDESAAMIEALTGFHWETDLTAFTEGMIGVIDLPRDSMLGYRVVGGGTDSQYVTSNLFTDNAGTSLFAQSFAAQAAGYVVDADFAESDGDQRHLLSSVELETRDEATLRAQIVDLHARIFGELIAVDDAETDTTFELYQAALGASSDPKRAWKTVLTALLSDFRAGNY
jgi:hypothetical protein